MLTFRETNGEYVIIETTHSFTKTWVKTVKFTKDLKRRQVGTNPWQNTIKADQDWFNKHYMKHFKGGKDE